MMLFVQLIVAVLSLIGSVFVLFLLVTSELNFKDQFFASCFGVLVTISAIAFFVLTRNDDNEETNPAKEKPRR